MMRVKEAAVKLRKSLASRALAGAADRSGMAATEFAMILPIMGMMFFGMLETSDAMMANRRIAHAANSLVDLVGQETQVSTSEVDDLMLGVMRMLEPTNSSTVAITLLSVIRDPSDPNKIIVDWSRDNNGGVPYASGAAYTKLDDGTNVHASASLVVVEMDYTYVSGLTNKVLGNSFHFNRIVSRWPRQSAKVELCANTPC